MSFREAGITAVLAISLFAASTAAQQLTKGGSAELLERTDSAARGREVVTGVYQWEPRTHTEWHTHPGEMVGHVVEGAMVLEQEGKSALTYTAGQTFVVPAGVAHDCINTLGSRTRVFVTYVVEKGKPISSPAATRR